MASHRYTEEQLIDAVATSKSIRQVLVKLGLAPKGGSYAVIKRYIKKLDLDTSHMTGQAWNRGRSHGPRQPIEFYLVKGKSVQSNMLRKRLIKEGIFDAVCSNCGLRHWMGGPIPLELEHKDGDHCNNELSNLELLCPNCHALTSTYRGKNKGHATVAE